MSELTHELLLELLDYDPATGIFTRRVKTPGCLCVGQIAGWNTDKGYRVISLLNRKWRAHRLAWFYVTKRWPEQEIDHVNGDRSDNRFANLREATRTQNLSNRGKNAAKKGLKGVHFDKRRGTWYSVTSVNNRGRYLGTFGCPAAAHFAYIVATEKLHGQFARAR